MKSFNTAAFEAKPIFSLTFSDGFITLLSLKTRIDDTCVAVPFSGGEGWGRGSLLASAAHLSPAVLAVE